MKIPFFSFQHMHTCIEEDIQKAIMQVIHSEQYILGKELSAFERAFSEFCGTAYAAGVGNGFDALYIALKVLGISAGDEVIVPAHSFIATATAVDHAMATPVMVDILEREYTIDPEKVKEKITDKTKAIIAVHLYGRPCRLKELLEIAHKNNIALIEDFAQAHGAMYDNKRVGSFGRINATSFYPVKNLGALGDGGAITTNDVKLYNEILIYRNYGSIQKYVHDKKGINSRLDELQSALLLIKLKKLDEWNKQRRKTAALYDELLNNVGDLILPAGDDKNNFSVYHQYVIRTQKRAKLQDFLKERGIGTLIHYPIPMHLQGCMKKYKYKRGEFPVAERLTDTCLSLPLYPGLTEEAIMYVVNSIRDFF